jgi:hypothetical protein
MLLKTHRFLLSLTIFEFVTKRASDENFNLNMFEMTLNRSEPSKELARRKVDLFKRYLDRKDIKCLLDWWVKHESVFSTIAYLAHQILDIVGLQIKIERIFFWLVSLQTLRDVICRQIT